MAMPTSVVSLVCKCVTEWEGPVTLPRTVGALNKGVSLLPFTTEKLPTIDTSDKGLVSKTDKGLTKLNIKKTKQPS